MNVNHWELWEVESGKVRNFCLHNEQDPCLTVASINSTEISGSFKAVSPPSSRNKAFLIPNRSFMNSLTSNSGCGGANFANIGIFDVSSCSWQGFCHLGTVDDIKKKVSPPLYTLHTHTLFVSCTHTSFISIHQASSAMWQTSFERWKCLGLVPFCWQLSEAMPCDGAKHERKSKPQSEDYI